MRSCSQGAVCIPRPDSLSYLLSAQYFYPRSELLARSARCQRRDQQGFGGSGRFTPIDVLLVVLELGKIGDRFQRHADSDSGFGLLGVNRNQRMPQFFGERDVDGIINR